jgi:hypothetical protein
VSPNRGQTCNGQILYVGQKVFLAFQGRSRTPTSDSHGPKTLAECSQKRAVLLTFRRLKSLCQRVVGQVPRMMVFAGIGKKPHLPIESYRHALADFRPNVPSASMETMLTAYVERGMPAYCGTSAPRGSR